MTVAWASVRECHLNVMSGSRPLSSRLVLVDGERRREVAVGIDLREKVVGLLLDGLDRVGSCNPAQRRLLLVNDGDQSFGELRGVAPCLPLIAFQAGRVAAVRSA